MTANFGNVRIDGSGAGLVNPRDWSPGWNEVAYERAVVHQLQRVRGYGCGRIVLGSLQRTSTVIPIDPRRKAGAGVDILIANQIHAVPSSVAMNPEVPVGTGQGTTSIVTYSPADWIRGTAGQSTVNGRADVVLLHELFHSVTVSRGLLRLRPLFHKDSPFSNSDEFNAVMVENIYCSQAGLRLRGAHNGPRTELPDPDGFYERHAHLIVDFCRDYPQISRALSALPTNFNPLRQYYRDSYGLPPSTNRALHNGR